MESFARFVLKFRKPIIIVFVAAAALSAALIPLVGVNYDMTDYLPKDAQSTQALDIMDAEFGSSVPNASVLVKDVSLTQALEYKRELAKVDGVDEVLWLDDMMDVTRPLEVADTATLEGFYKDGSALFSLTIADGMEKDATDDIWQLIGEDNAITGDAADLAAMQQATVVEVLGALAILLPVILAILVLSTSSWVEPVLFIGAIGVSIAINMGTNVFLGQVSFMTNSVSPILQLAVSLDYAIFLLHSFSAYREKYGDDIERAMRHAIKASMSTVAASAATTLFGFLALAFMKFGIGADLGLNLAKGIVLSFISCMVFLPALTLSLYKLIDKTRHRPLMPAFKKVNRVFSKLMVPAVLLVLVLLVPSFLGQSRTDFIYGNGSADPEMVQGRSSLEVEAIFGKTTTMVLLVPRGDVAREAELCAELEALPHVDSVMAYATTVGTTIPQQVLSEDVTSQFYSENYARIIAYTDTDSEGAVAFATVEEVTAVAQSYYGEAVYSAGQSANLYDMRAVVQKDNRNVTLIAVIAIFMVLVITFKSASLPFILLLTIETGIWINLAIPYFTGTSINFIGYLVLNTVQLGATVDYAILLTNTYLKHRRLLPQRQAMSKAMGDSFSSILVSAATLATAGFTLFATSTKAAVADIGLLLGRGTILSFVMVLCFLPAMLKIFDKVIDKTTYKARFFREDKSDNAAHPAA